MKIDAINFPALKTGRKVDFKKTAFAPEREETGNRVEPLIDGPAIFSSAAKMLKEAKSSIQVEMYTLDNRDMLNLLCSEAKKGISVQVLLDPNAARDPKTAQAFKKDTERLKASGVEVLKFPTGNKRLDHVKLLIVDGNSVLVGGMNWGSHSPVNHDADIKLEGPAVNYYRQFFNSGWKVSGGKNIPVLPGAEKIPGADAEVEGLCTDAKKVHTIKNAVADSIHRAQKSIHLEAFILSDKSTIAGLMEAKQRGVEVKVLLDVTGVVNRASPNEETFDLLKEAGIEVRWYTTDESVKQKMHAKWGVFDGEELIVGSANWSRKGLTRNREIGVRLQDPKTASAFETQFQHDWENRSTDITPD